MLLRIKKIIENNPVALATVMDEKNLMSRPWLLLRLFRIKKFC